MQNMLSPLVLFYLLPAQHYSGYFCLIDVPALKTILAGGILLMVTAVFYRQEKINMKHILLLLLATVISVLSAGASNPIKEGYTISGHVIVKGSEENIAYANVYIIENSMGTGFISSWRRKALLLTRS